MSQEFFIHVFEIFCATFSMSLGTVCAAYAQCKVICTTLEGMARQPETASSMHSSMILGLAMIESLAIYCLLVSMILLMIKW